MFGKLTNPQVGQSMTWLTVSWFVGEIVSLPLCFSFIY